MTIIIENENRVPIEYGILMMYELNGDNYMAIVPVDKDNSPLNASIRIIGYEESGDDFDLYHIDGKAEYEMAVKAFRTLVDMI